MLLKSWATRPASRPTASIFWAWRSHASSVFWSASSAPESFRDVVDQHEVGAHAVELEAVGLELDAQDQAVLRPMSSRRVLRRSECGDFLPKRGDVFRRLDVRDGHRRELFAAVPVVSNRGLVDGEERERLDVEYPHGLGAALEERAIPGLGLAQVGFGSAPGLPAFAFAELALDRRSEPSQLALQHEVVRAGAHGGDRGLLANRPRHDDERYVEACSLEQLQGGDGAEVRH